MLTRHRPVLQKEKTMKRRWHDYDDGFDEADLLDDDDLEFPVASNPVKSRPRLRPVERGSRERDSAPGGRAGARKRGPRQQAWGAPH
jgi:hypothetical protein